MTEADEAGKEVSAPLLTVKLVQPELAPDLLLRPELVERLADGASRVCLISAPAGWGKTSLLSAWLSRRNGQRTAFLRLEEGDDVGPLFWLYVIAALRRIRPGLVAGADDELRRADVDPMREVVPSLLNELAESDQPLLLVLDDYHVITEPAIHSSVGYLIDHLPPGVQLAIATRADPRLPLGRLRAKGDLMELRARDLAFSTSETEELLRNRFGVDLDDRDVELLSRRTEGWPAAVHLAGLSLRGAEDPSGFVVRFAGDDRNVADYLMGEALGRVSEADRDFLLRTSVLEQMTGPLCEEVAGVNDGAAMLDRIDRSGLFLIPLDNQRRWYRYHHLFADWLRHELRKTDPEMIPTLHLAASRWYSQTGALEPAVDHASDAGDYLLTAQLIDRYLRDWTNVNWSLVWRWFQVLPDDAIRTYPMTAVARFNVALSLGDFASSSQWLEAAEAALDAVPADLLPTLETTLEFHRAFGALVAGGDVDYARTALLAIADQERSRDSIIFAQASAAAGMAAFWATGPLDAIPLLHEGALARRRRSVRDGGTTALLALAYAEVGDWEAAQETATDALTLPELSEWVNYPDRMFAHYALGKALLASGERDEAAASIGTGLGMAREWVEPIFVAYGCLALAECRTDYAEKRALVREARSLIDGPGGRGRVIDLVATAERRLALRRPQRETAGTVHVEPLTDRELEVLRMLRSDLSLREIASELYISHNTIKSYTKSIYRKLGVTSRSAALEVADDIDLG
ncbi:MAG: LuxR C-terminal-related transcriptional regulator [Acidimicrobiia bacterium]|nr:LuxR C-terminal-related transcriptional regulator [Acidimicrobiia bacterium]